MMNGEERAALIIIDMGQSVLEGKIRQMAETDAPTAGVVGRWLHEQVLPNLVKLAAHFRATGRPVVFVNWASYRTMYPQLQPLEGDVVVKKQSRGAFPTSDLDAQLKELGVTTCVFTGADSAVCVSSTLRGAIDRGYKAVLVTDASLSSNPLMHEAEAQVLAYNGASIVTTAQLLGEPAPVRPAGWARNLRLSHTFDHDAEMWHVYDYAACEAAGHDVYRAAQWTARGGADGGGFIAADDSQWSVDTPEDPHSVLVLMTWRHWYLRGPADMRDAVLSVHLRGDKLDLNGGRCLFWVMCRRMSTRFHLAGRPLTIGDGAWASNEVTLAPQPDLWHRSWTVPGHQPADIASLLSEVDSYGFSFVGFSEKPTGRFCVDLFRLDVRG